MARSSFTQLGLFSSWGAPPEAFVLLLLLLPGAPLLLRVCFRAHKRHRDDSLRRRPSRRGSPERRSVSALAGAGKSLFLLDGCAYAAWSSSSLLAAGNCCVALSSFRPPFGGSSLAMSFMRSSLWVYGRSSGSPSVPHCWEATGNGNGRRARNEVHLRV